MLQNILSQIDKDLLYIGENVKTSFGTIDVVASKQGRPVAIKLKDSPYQSNSIIGHLHNYARHVAPRSGEVYFVAPYITPQVENAFAGYMQVHLVALGQEQVSAVKKYVPSKLEKKVNTVISHPLLQYAKRKLLG